MSSPAAARLPKIDFSGLDPSNPGTDAWTAVRAQVMPVLYSHSCFEAVYDKVTPELQDALLDKAAKELFSLPLETKAKNTSEKPYHGYIAHKNYESLNVELPTEPQGPQKFSALMWGTAGNPTFCEEVCRLARKLSELDQMVRRMVLESLGVERHYESHIGSTAYNLRLSKYGVQIEDEEGGKSKSGMRGHTDVTMVTIVCQHGVEGLQVLTKNGRWITPSPNSLTVMLGQAFMAYSNGRLEPPFHRVSMAGASKTRYSAIFSSSPKDGYMVQAPEELIDAEHPLQFKPYDYNDYVRFCFSESGLKTKSCALRVYCGVAEGN